MKQENKWDKFYRETPLEKISWQKAQDDYLKEVIASNLLKPGSALDLGCGTGVKSVFLAQKGFNVTGIDISEKAIEYANKNSTKAKLDINFITEDATDLSFLGNEKFNFILDWANLHGMPKEKRREYISEIYKHTRTKGKLLLRCFGRKENEEEFVIRPMGKIYLLTKKEIEKLYKDYFKIIKSNVTKSSGPNPPGKFFYEFLMERIEK